MHQTPEAITGASVACMREGCVWIKLRPLAVDAFRVALARLCLGAVMAHIWKWAVAGSRRGIARAAIFTLFEEKAIH